MIAYRKLFGFRSMKKEITYFFYFRVNDEERETNRHLWWGIFTLIFASIIRIAYMECTLTIHFTATSLRVSM